MTKTETTKTIAFFVNSELQWTRTISVRTLDLMPERDIEDMIDSMEECEASEADIEDARSLFETIYDNEGHPVKWGLDMNGLAQYTVVLD